MKTQTQTLEENLSYLRLNHVREVFADAAGRAANGGISHIDFLAELGEAEAAARRESAVARRLQEAKLPYLKTLDQFRWSHPEKINRQQVENILHLGFIERKENVVLLGGCGLGKTHLAIAIAAKACREGHSTLFAGAVDIVNCLTVTMGDDWGDQRGVLIGPERWRKFFKPRYARIFAAVHAQGKLAIMHCSGSAADIMSDVVEIGLDVIESVQPEAAGMNPYALKKLWGDKITFWGCLGTQQMIPFATPAEIRGEIRRLRGEMGKGGGYILAPAKPLRPETSTENAVAVVEEFLAG
jgi:hypothetical protein